MTDVKKNSKKKKIIATVVVLCLLVIYGITIAQLKLIPNLGKYVTEEDAAEHNNDSASNETDENDTMEKGPIVLSYEDYMEQPSPSYGIYLEPVKVKGIYVSGPVAGMTTGTKSINTLIDLVNETELNAMVIDVKNDDGLITFNSEIPLAGEIGANRNYIRDIYGLMESLKENNIFPIARIVAFKDPYLAERRPDLAIKNKDGSIWRYKGIAWINPYNQDSWEYIIDVAKEAARVGFKEIQFDYIRFEATSYLDQADLGPMASEKTRMDMITAFTEYAMKELKPLGVYVSADVFGTIITSKVDADRIGQNYVEMAKNLDYICPMVYPSHYGYGFFGIPSNKHSDLYPYETIKGSMEDSNEKLREIPEGEDRAIVRPWLQAFTASYLKNNPWTGEPNWRTYDAEEIRAQIQATYDAGLEEWILWNAGNTYTKDGLLLE